MIRGAPSKKQEDVVLFSPKGRKSVVGVLTTFCQRCFFTMRNGDSQVETNLINLSRTETAQQLRWKILSHC
jgi:hypothetical protein